MEKIKKVSGLSKFFNDKYGGTWEYDGKATWWNDTGLRWIVRLGKKYYIHNPKDERGIRLVSWDDGLIKEAISDGC